MKAALYREFSGPIEIQNLKDPEPAVEGVVIKVEATGICRSDWHGWMGHDSDITLPHVPGHELSGIVVDRGNGVSKFKKGDRVTLPFVCGCGDCDPCKSGNQQVCHKQFQPGFTHWGSFAEYVAIDYADINLVLLPESLNFVTAASLGCRFATSWRAISQIGKINEGEWLAVHGCGGVGLSAIMIAKAMGARLIAVDTSDAAIMWARKLGAEITINPHGSANVVEDILEASSGGADISLDALGSVETCRNSILCLKTQGKHIQVGLMAGKEKDPTLPMDAVIAKELQLFGSHGMAAYTYPEMLQMIEEDKLEPQKLIQGTVGLKEGIYILQNMDNFSHSGITVITDLGN
jgi:alcohol dehydrogenase